MRVTVNILNDLNVVDGYKKMLTGSPIRNAMPLPTTEGMHKEDTGAKIAE